MDTTEDLLAEWHHQRRCIHLQYIRILRIANKLVKLAEQSEESADDAREV